MALTAGSHHVATLTADIDRLIRFYGQVFDADVVLDMREEGVRHVFIDLGGGFLLHPFEIPGIDVPQGEVPIFDRGRIDHLALKAETAEAFWTLRERIYGGSKRWSGSRSRFGAQCRLHRSGWTLGRSLLGSASRRGSQQRKGGLEVHLLSQVRLARS